MKNKKNLVLFVFLIILMFISACTNKIAKSNSQDIPIEITQPTQERTKDLSANIVIEGVSDIPTDYVNFPSIMIENTGDYPISMSIDVGIISYNNVLHKSNNVIFLSGTDSIETIYPGEKLRGKLNYAYTEEFRHNWKIKVDLRNGASADIIATAIKCLSVSCDDEQQQIREPPKQAIPWEEFFEECKKKYPSTQWNNPSLAEKFTDECERDYAKEFVLLDWCDKIKDRAIQQECYFNIAVVRRDPGICQAFFIGGEKTDCLRSVR